MSDSTASVPVESHISAGCLSAFVQTRKAPPYKPIDIAELVEFSRAQESVMAQFKSRNEDCDEEVKQAVDIFYEKQ